MVPEAGPSSHVKKSTKGKSAGKARAKRLNRDIQDDIEEAEAELRKANARIRTLKEVKDGLAIWLGQLNAELEGESE